MYLPQSSIPFGAGPGQQNPAWDPSGAFRYDTAVKSLYAPIIAEATQQSRSLNVRLAEIINALDGINSPAFGITTAGMVNDGAIVGGNIIGGTFTGTDNGPALQGLLDYCGQTGKALFIPPGMYRFADSGGPGSGTNIQTTLIQYSQYIIFAEPGTVQFLIDDAYTAPGVGADTYSRWLFSTTSTFTNVAKAPPNKQLFYVRGITFQGRWSQLNLAGWDGGHYRAVAAVGSMAKIHWDNCQFFDIRGGMFGGSINVGGSSGWGSIYNSKAMMTRCAAHRIARGNVDRWLDTSHIIFMENDVRWCDDNPSASVTASGNPVRQQYILANNVFEQCDAADHFGAKSAVLVGNVMRFMRGGAITIFPNGQTTGANQVSNAIVAHNTIENTTTGVAAGAASFANAFDGAGEFDPGSFQADIIVSSAVLSNATTGGHAGKDYPGWPNNAGTAIIDPIGVDSGPNLISMNNYGNTVESMAAGDGIIVAFNTIKRTAGAIGAYSNFLLLPGNNGEGAAANGYCKGYSFDGWIDPAILDDNNGTAGHVTNYSLNGIRLGGDVRNVMMMGNAIVGKRRGAAISLVCDNVGVSQASPDRNKSFRNVYIGPQVIEDCRFAIVSDQMGSARGPFTAGIDIDGLSINGDPYYLQPERGAAVDGSWQDKTAATVFKRPGGIVLDSWQGLRIRNVTFANVYDPIIGGGNPIDTYFDIKDNLIRGKPNTLAAWNANNLGIAVPHVAGARFWYQIWDTALGSATYGQLLNNCVRSASTMPNTGTYVRGLFVQATSSVFPNLLGWLRLTTGNGHVLATDWLEIYADNYNLQINNYQLVSTDVPGIISMQSGTAKSVTIPPAATAQLPLHQPCRIVQRGAGAVTVLAGGGVTLNGAVVATAAVGQTLAIYQESADSWVVMKSP